MRLLAICLCLMGSVTWAQRVRKIEKPKLVLVVVFDQFRADYLTRFESRFLPARLKNGKLGGFRYLMERGAYFPQAQYGVLQNMTCPGHATVLTGAYPYEHGIEANYWFDAESHKLLYCVEDPNVAPVGGKVGAHAGTSPNSLQATTFGDELKNAGLKSKVVAVSLKDRAAILLGGHRADLALWMSDDFHWMSSRYYLPKGDLPAWVKSLNERLQKEKGKTLVWGAVGGGSGRSASENHFRRDEKAGTQNSFLLPFGVEKTVEVAEEAIKNMKLGRSGDPDLLAVSFSTHDFLGHLMGPNSREMEEITVAEDQNLSRLLNFVNEKIPGGVRNTVIVMTGDHGIGASPEYLKDTGIPAGHIDQEAIRKALNEFLNRKFKSPSNGDWVLGATELNFYFNHQEISEQKLSLDEMEKQAAAFLRNRADLMKGIAHVFTASDVRARTLPQGRFEKQILHTFYRGRSGDLIVIPKPYFIIGKAAANHLTGYAYDRTVPLLFAGGAIRPGVYANPARVIDIAPTLSFLTGVIPPSGAEGRVLGDVLK